MIWRGSIIRGHSEDLLIRLLKSQMVFWWGASIIGKKAWNGCLYCLWNASFLHWWWATLMLWNVVFKVLIACLCFFKRHWNENKKWCKCVNAWRIRKGRRYLIIFEFYFSNIFVLTFSFKKIEWKLDETFRKLFYFSKHFIEPSKKH